MAIIDNTTFTKTPEKANSYSENILVICFTTDNYVNRTFYMQ